MFVVPVENAEYPRERKVKATPRYFMATSSPEPPPLCRANMLQDCSSDAAIALATRKVP